MHVVEFVAGLALLLIVFADVFSTMLVPRPSHSRVRIGPAVNGALEPLWRRASLLFRSPRLRQDFRGGFAPAILVLMGAGWIFGLALGFALLLHALPYEVKSADHSFAEALFQAALAISTEGLVHADVEGWARAVVAIAGLSGFAVLTLIVAFVLSIQNALGQRESLVLTLTARAGRPPTAEALLLAKAGADDAEMAAFFDNWEMWTAQVMQSHLSYPVLFRFRSLDENSEWLLCLGAVMSAAEPPNMARARRAAGFLVATASRALKEFARFEQIEDHRPALDREDLAAVERALARGGFTATPPAAFGERLHAIRSGYAGRLPLIAERLDIAWRDTLTVGPGRTSAP